MDYMTIKGVALDAIFGHKPLFLRYLEGTEIDVDNANESQSIAYAIYKKFKVVGVGVLCTEQTQTDNEIILEFGYAGDDNAYSTLTITVASGNVEAGEYFFNGVYDEMFPADVSADGVAAWVDGDKWNTEETVPRLLDVIEAGVDHNAGKFVPFTVVEVLK